MENNTGFVPTNSTFENVTSQETGLTVIQGMADDGSRFIINLTSRKLEFCSMVPKDEAEQGILFNAMNSPAKRTKDTVGEIIEIKDVFVEVVDLKDEKTGLLNPCPRVVLIDKNGVGYQSVSVGIYGSVCKLFKTFGTPEKWTKPLKVKVKQVTKGLNTLLTLEWVAK